MKLVEWRLNHPVPMHVTLCLKDDRCPRGSRKERFINGVPCLCLVQPMILGIVLSRLALLVNEYAEQQYLCEEILNSGSEDCYGKPKTAAQGSACRICIDE